MGPRIEQLKEKKLVGRRLKMSFANNRTFELWQSFMPLRKNIPNSIDANLYSLQRYEDFNLHTEFEKWAALEVSDFGDIPENTESLILEGGLYAVFIHKGTPAGFQKTFQYIYEQWMPDSPYELDERMHFELLGDKYKNNDPSSEEEIWVPIKPKASSKN